MQHSPLGATGLQVSQVALGTAPLGGGLFGDCDEQQAERVVHEALDLGITLVDTSPYYGDAEGRLGRALRGGRRDRVVLATKAGRYGGDDFDFSASRIRSSLQRSLDLLQTDHVDVFQLHDVEFVPLEQIREVAVPALLALREEGLVRAVGVTGYPVETICALVEEFDLDVVLTYAHATLLDDSLQTRVLPVAEANGTAVMNAAAVSLGLLTPNGGSMAADHPATPVIREAAAAVVALCEREGVDVARLANQYSIQRSGAVTTVIGTRKPANVRAAVEAASEPVDEDLLAAVLALRPPADQRTWPAGGWKG